MSAMRSILVSLMMLTVVGNCSDDVLMQSNVYVEGGVLASKTTLGGVTSTAYGHGTQREVLDAKTAPSGTQFSWDYQLDGSTDDSMNYVKFQSKGNGMSYKTDSWASSQMMFTAESNISAEGSHEVFADMMQKNAWAAGERMFTGDDSERWMDLIGNASMRSRFRAGNKNETLSDKDWLEFCALIEKLHPANKLNFMTLDGYDPSTTPLYMPSTPLVGKAPSAEGA